MPKNKQKPPATPHTQQAGEADGKWRLQDEHFKSDVLGSYTGKPMDGEKPVQDADDL